MREKLKLGKLDQVEIFLLRSIAIVYISIIEITRLPLVDEFRTLDWKGIGMELSQLSFV